MDKLPFISIIVPVYNGGKFLDQCLDALTSSSYQSYELIVVDDGSTDDSAEISRQKGARVLQTPRRQSGPAAARNYGAQKAQGGILFFVDADVVVQQKTVAQIAGDFLKYPDIAAVFGSYDDSPAESNFLSQYKNLYHHFVHQQSSSNAVTFWAGCGAVSREVFTAVGGFNERQYPKPSIEDIELGYRIRSLGWKIHLDKEIQVKHLKRWTVESLLRADIVYRAIPWSKLILESRHMVNDLNLKTSDRLSAGLVGLSAGTLSLSLFEPRLLYFTLLFFAIVFILNYKLYGFFMNRKGVVFAALAFPWQILYYFYSGVTYALCWGRQVFLGWRVELKGNGR